MSYDTADIAARLQAARKARGLSQRELSDLAGVPQAQISRIEAGTVDLRLSSLVALAHALDLEPTLVPRKALPAVRSLSRDAVSASRKDIVAAQKEIQRISETMRGLQIKAPNLEGLQQLQKSFSELQRFRVPTLDLKGLKQLRQALELINRPTQDMAALSQSIKLMQSVRNKAAHGPVRDADDIPSRPAYSLDDEDDDA
ncbi:transcriptional regulator [Rhodobacter veldkampii DSM 11550]|uniref:XRE family transcriptional regulator n=1 Tax=Phaeovulum veldkampii DSM 11550 TaxID=1185920 RepID=A0A2T4JD14_9RHOB|nr:helix-turn-helix transcriptional regulator [Phaeovulum veldkampii]MBK5946254.1 transcriptional regulator [Phaeovulum veldkampii DSM 11550]PTE15800.1 XRE family transcriptional regulator [Phaeovulum veldkampii DSM 11550]TDQ54518.1 helix-turn-helix protein [Phaeovulum veldkampii DSM 11550]